MTEKKEYIYFMGVCGTGMGSLAGLVKSLGYEVAGSDEHVYPPMSTQLERWGIEIKKGFKAENLVPRPDRIVVGNVIRSSNREAEAMRAADIPHISMPEAIAEFGIGDKHSIVIAGTHGKTTTTALTSHLLRSAERDPSFLVGGVLVDYPTSFSVGSGDAFVIEGDEYDTAYFDKGPKFRHYRPTTALISSLEFDHADIFSDVEAVEAAFKQLIEATSDDGRLVVWKGASRALALARAHRGERQLCVYDTEPGQGVDVHLASYETRPEGLVFEPVVNGNSLGHMRTGMWGEFSARNALAALCCLLDRGLSNEQVAKGFSSFGGVKRRMEVLGEPRGVTVVDDFGHHPTAVAVTLAAARKRWPGRRVWAVFEPRSATSRRDHFETQYVDSLGRADCVVVGHHARLGEIPEGERFSPRRVAASIERAGGSAESIDGTEAIVERLVAGARAEDVVIIFSNGDFDGLHGALLARLSE